MTKNTSTALLVMDMQQMLLGTLPGAETVVKNIATAIAGARSANIPVIYIVVGFRSGLPEVNPANKSFRQLQARLGNTDPVAMTTIAAELTPQENDIIITKKRYSAFAGSDLEVVLRSQGIRHLVLTGIVTSGVVLATFLEAADKDFELTVLADGCQDRDPQLHQLLLEKVFPRSGEVKNCADWTD